jgi:isoleucyl-tRNA synthetase
MHGSFRPVAPQVSFPEMERRILAYWSENQIVSKGLARNQGAEEWVFYEGPPTANAPPGVHHVEARVFKDIFCRFHAMRGRYVHRKGGWDCHGLPVELEVEKELGLTSKQEIEAFGVAAFNERCRESVRRYVREWEAVTARMAFWINMEDAYWTMSPDYVESVWWSLKKLFDDGLLFLDYRSAPYCPRCETPLSDHELGQPDVYQMVGDPSIFVRLPLEDEEADLLVWTTTPWTLPSNLAAAVHPEVTYAKVRAGGRPVIVAEPLVGAVLGDDAQVLETFAARRLEGRKYRPPFRFAEPDRPAWFVVLEDFVTTSDGTGVVHIAPAFGAEDLETGRRHDLPFVNFVDLSGRFVDSAAPFAGLPIKEADPLITEDLRARGLLFRAETYEHNYPHCWRCRTPLLYCALESWYVRTTARKQELLEQNEATAWYPETIKEGRYGEWLRNNVDWALSRTRYWGTPLPIFRCRQAHFTCVGSRAELSELTGTDHSQLDPHRPFVDDITFPCPHCGEQAERVPHVIDTWYDSGSMPFAQWGYPAEGVTTLENRFPADFIAEALDQTRGWFYTLMAVSTLLFGRSSYRNVLCLGLLVDDQGRKMSKSLGNVLDPGEIFERFGADALRWWMFISGSPWANRRIGAGTLDELVRRYLLTIWNTYSFFITYANADGFDPADTAPADEPPRPEIDRWVLAELNDTVREVSESLEAYDALRGGRRLDRFVDDLSNWFVRRSRRRFWRSESDADKLSAYRTLHECLVKLSKLAAPFTPFIAEEIFTNLTGRESVHLDDWPESDSSLIDEELMLKMRTARTVVSLGRAARNEARVKTRQPLPKALVAVPANQRDGLKALEELILEELNVKALEYVDSLDVYVDYEVKPNFSSLGPKIGAKVQKVASAIASAGAAQVREQLRTDGEARFVIDGEETTIAPGDLEVRARPREGFASAHEGPLGVALDLQITADLRLEGLAREMVRAINDARREARLDVSDRIFLHLDARGELGQGFDAHREWISGEVLATKVVPNPPRDAFSKRLDIDGMSLVVSFAKAAN